jgi:hypothetical protein
MSVPVFQSQHAESNANGDHTGTALSPDEEVMPAGVVNTSGARGNALFKLNAAGDAIDYRLNVSQIENVFAAHIHLGAPGSNGGVVVFLYPSTANQNGPVGGGPIQGVISQGTITAANLINALAGQPLSALVAEIEAGNAYVNVHTNDGIAPTNTGPGDYPGGEVRGQIDRQGH